MIEPGPASRAALDELVTARERQRSARADLTAVQRAAVLCLLDDGATYRDIAALVSLSYQRVGQIVDEAHAGPERRV